MIINNTYIINSIIRISFRHQKLENLKESLFDNDKICNVIQYYNSILQWHKFDT